MYLYGDTVSVLITLSGCFFRLRFPSPSLLAAPVSKSIIVSIRCLYSLDICRKIGPTMEYCVDLTGSSNVRNVQEFQKGYQFGRPSAEAITIGADEGGVRTRDKSLTQPKISN